MKSRKVILIVSFVLVMLMPFMLAAAPAQGEVPEAGEVAVVALEEEGEPQDAMELLQSFLDPVVGLAGKVIVIVFGLAIFLVCTVVGTNIMKMFFPKSEKWEWYLNLRPKIIRFISFVVSVFILSGSNVDFFGMLTLINEVFEIPPIFAQVLSGGALGFASNWYYDNKLK